ncbi:chromosome segregation protein SMC [Parvularcula oceani]|uniref:chromosome segregation protein SMC n=1 Tax=Parvularcula oceani TaxID=1247963 RepID=UPI0004E12686|nr:chromosome segregation protein SMC [Parvularcula oceani]
MRFDKLRLTGFKSFVEPAELDILPGLTGVVGPNGCGKSNLLEALRWVMGASSAKALRAGGMEDVIFAGTGAAGRPGRPARQWAEVTLSLDNEDRTAPSEWNEHARLEVTRRITKRGDGASSTFRINGKEVRARDVQLLFADAATGASSPALVRQGQVSELIAAKPQNRRRLLEEAAGVTGLHARRHEAELRLKATSANLERLDDVTGGLESQRATLARQARQATRYRNIAGHLRRAEAMLAYLRWRSAAEAETAARTTLDEAEKRTQETAGAAASAQGERERQHAAIEPLRRKEAEAAAALHRLEAERDGFEAEVERAQAVIARLTRTKARLEDDLSREETLSRDAEAALANLAEEQQRLEEQEAPLRSALEETEAEAARLDEALAAAQNEHDAAQSALSEAEAERRAAAAARDSQSRSAQRAAQERDQLQRSRDEAEAGASDEVERLTRLRDDAAAALAEAERHVAEAEDARARAGAAFESARGPHDEAVQALTTLQAEAKALRGLLAASAPEEGAVLDSIEVEAGAEAALAAALGDGLSASLAKDAQRRWSPLGEEALRSAELPDGVEPLSALVRSAPPALRRRIAATGVVAAADGEERAAALAPGQRLVSREGDLWRWDGFTSRAGARTQAALRLEQRRRLEETETELAGAERRRKEEADSLAEAKALAEQAAQTEKDARRAIRDRQDAARRADKALSDAQAERQKRTLRLEALGERLAAAEDQLRAARAELAAAEERLLALPAQDGLRKRLEAARLARSEAQSAASEARGRRAELRRDEEARVQRLIAAKQQAEGWRGRKDAASERILSVRAVAEDVSAQLAQAERVPPQLEEKRENLFERLTIAESRRDAARRAVEEAGSALAEAEAAHSAAQEEAIGAREARARAIAQLEAARERLGEAEARAQEVQEGDLEALLSLAEHGEDAPLPDADAVEARIEKLRRERSALGAVNLVADREMAEVDERLEEITSERADCEAAIAKLRGAIGALNRDGRQKLLAAFEVVNGHFQSLFKELFGGGEAQLALVDSDDPLEAGLEILASPPGKKLASMSLMSGGEQALTATALIFAVFRANPAPVCVLDEVDAPLDDANVERFCRMLSQMTEETQTRFLIITHHALTMSRVDRLYGVTMIERGVSQLVSVDLREAAEMAA